MTALTACSTQIHPTTMPTSEGHLTTERVVGANDNHADVPSPVRTSDLVPPPQPAAQLPTYSVVVTEVPVKELLQALARDTKQNIDIHPALSGLVSLNAINETLPAILDRVSKQVNMRYRIDGNTIIVTPDTPYTKTYKVNYINMTRDTTSTAGVSGQITDTSQLGSGGTSSSSTNASSTTVTTKSTNDFWKKLEDNIRAILNSTKQQNLTADAKAERLAAIKQAQDEQAKQIEAASKGGAQGASELTAALAGTSRTQTALLPDDVVVNPFTGTIVVNATEKQHKLVQEYLDGVSRAIEKQVLIEATIVEVRLSKTYQAGIDWSRLGNSGFSFTQTLLSGFGGTNLTQQGSNSMQVGYANGTNDINGTLKLLQEFGNTKVLSSPKLMALNNQTALLKVVDNLVYFEIEAQTNQSQTQSQTTFTSTAKTVAVGMVMDVTPEIGDDGRVTLTVRPTVSRLIDYKNDPNPNLCDANRQNCISNQVPEIRTREMESVLQVGSGQTVVLGGLMQDDTTENRQEVPGASLIGPFGELFRFRDDNNIKTELVIFLRPTVISNPTLDSAELQFYQRFLPKAPNTSDATKSAP